MTASGYGRSTPSSHQRRTCGCRSQPRTSARSSSRSGVKEYLGVIGDVEPRERLRERDAFLAPAARRVVLADPRGEIVGVEANLREHARGVRLCDLSREAVVRRAEALADVEEPRQRERALANGGELRRGHPPSG